MPSKNVIPFILATAFFLSSGCFDSDIDIPAFDCESLGALSSQCVDEKTPLKFHENTRNFAIGAESYLSPMVHVSLEGFFVESSDSEIVRVSLEGEYIKLRALQEGKATIRARRSSDTSFLDSIQIHVLPISTVQFISFPNPEAPLQKLIGLVNSTGIIGVSFLNENGGELDVGNTVKLSATGSAFVVPTARPPRISIRFKSLGEGQLIVEIQNEEKYILPIVVIDSVDSYTVNTLHELNLNKTSKLFLHGYTADGVRVAGVKGTWSFVPDVLVDGESSSIDEVHFVPQQLGTLRVKVVIDDTTVEEEFIVKPAN